MLRRPPVHGNGSPRSGRRFKDRTGISWDRRKLVGDLFRPLDQETFFCFFNSRNPVPFTAVFVQFISERTNADVKKFCRVRTIAFALLEGYEDMPFLKVVKGKKFTVRFWE